MNNIPDNFKKMLASIPKKECLFILFSPLTREPFVACDEKTFDDKVFIYTEEADAHAAANELIKEKSTPAIVVKFENKDFLHIFGNCKANGVDIFVFQMGNEAVLNVPVPMLVTTKAVPGVTTGRVAPDAAGSQNGEIVENPSLMMSLLYILQDKRRPDADKTVSRDKDEEIAHNFINGRFLLPVIEKPLENAEEAEAQTAPEISESEQANSSSADIMNSILQDNFKNPPKTHNEVMLIKTKDGRFVVPLFSDIFKVRSYAKDNRNKHIRLLFVNLKQLSNMNFNDLPDGTHIDTFLLNPGSIAFALSHTQIKALAAKEE